MYDLIQTLDLSRGSDNSSFISLMKQIRDVKKSSKDVGAKKTEK